MVASATSAAGPNAVNEVSVTTALRRMGPLQGPSNVPIGAHPTSAIPLMDGGDDRARQGGGGGGPHRGRFGRARPVNEASDAMMALPEEIPDEIQELLLDEGFDLPGDDEPEEPSAPEHPLARTTPIPEVRLD